MGLVLLWMGDFEPRTQWTLTLREGITFHDGTPFDAEAVKYNMETCMGSGLAAPTYANIGTLEADGQVEVVVEGDRESVDRMELALRRGPAGARVDSFDVDERPPAHRPTGFAVR